MRNKCRLTLTVIVTIIFKFPGILLMALNFDCFQPFMNTQYSLGVQFLTGINATMLRFLFW